MFNIFLASRRNGTQITDEWNSTFRMNVYWTDTMYLRRAFCYDILRLSIILLHIFYLFLHSEIIRDKLGNNQTNKRIY